MIPAPATASLTTVLDIAATVPPAASPLVDRENMLDTVDRMFTSGVEVVCVEGDDGIGKTTLLRQAALRHSGSCACLFIRPVSRLAYDLSSLRFDLCNQLHWHVHSVTLPIEHEADDSVFRQKILELSRRMGRTSVDTFYFVVDGLEDIPESDTFARKAILDMLPFGRKGLRFLISGAADRLLGNRSRFLTLKPFSLSPFSPGETKDYLADLVQDEGHIREIHLAVKGIPGKLSAIRRLVSSGLSPDRLLEELPTEFQDLFELEWEQVPDVDKDLKRLLSLLAFSKTQVTFDDLAQVFRLPVEDVVNRLSTLTFLRVDTSSNEVVFESESIRRFARKKLRELERSVLDLHTEHLLRMPLSAPAIQALPAYLEASGNEKRIIEYLSRDYFSALLTKARAFAPLTRSAGLGAATAKKLGAHRDALRFTLFSNIFQELAAFRTNHAEIEALIALDLYPAAVAAASLATLPEDRLHLFSLIARLKKEAGMEPEAALLDELQQTFRQVSAENVHPSKAMEIAADLLPVSPELAISLVEGAAKAGLGENALDAAFASLTIRAAIRDKEGRTHGALDAVKQRITDEKTQGLVGVLTEFLSPVSASALIVQLGRLERAGDKALLLRNWCVRNAQRDDALEAVQYGLDMALGSTAYSANAAYYRDLAMPLPATGDIEHVSKLVRLFDGQDYVMRATGPTEDYVQLQLLLAEADQILPERKR